jgi:hypothetical protein
MVESPRPGTEADFGRYVTDYAGMIVAHAECSVCRSKYLAWLDGTTAANTHGHPWPKPVRDDAGVLTIQDLSFRQSFNDEPGPDDYPEFVVEWVAKLTPWPKCDRCGKAQRTTYTGSQECTDHRCCSRAAGEALCTVHDAYHHPDRPCWQCAFDAKKTEVLRGTR